MYINSNYNCQAATDTIDFTPLIKADLELKLKVSSKATPVISEYEDLALNNYINGDAKYTKFDFANLSDDHSGKAFSLNINIPTAPSPNPNKKVSYGLIAVYYIKDAAETETKGAYILAKDGNSSVTGLEFFNTTETSNPRSRLNLNNKLNIIKVNPEVKQLEIYADEAKKSTIIFGSLDLVKDINPKLDYQLTDDVTEAGSATTELEQLLKDIRMYKITKDFYYNVPIQRSNEIDLNPAIAEDKLSSPLS
jgi:hypothetical protein